MAQDSFESNFREALLQKFNQCKKYLIPKDDYYKTIEDYKAD